MSLICVAARIRLSIRTTSGIGHGVGIAVDRIGIGLRLFGKIGHRCAPREFLAAPGRMAVQNRSGSGRFDPRRPLPTMTCAATITPNRQMCNSRA